VKASRASWLSVSLATIAIVAMTHRAATAAAENLLPDLTMAPIEDVWVDHSPAGGRFLRFAATMANVGAGPLELREPRSALGAAEPAMRQVIHTSTGGSREVSGNVRMEYAGDGHDHWHAVGIMGYELRSPGGLTRRTMKTGFCFWDGRALAPPPEGSPTEPVYEPRSCLGQSAGPEDPENPVFMGLSPGWTDTYPSRIAWQWIDISGLPAGTYLLVLRADPAGLFLEVDRQNNCATVEIHVTPNAARTGAHGTSCPPAAPEIAHDLTLSESLAAQCRALDAREASATTPGLEAICRLVTPSAAPAVNADPRVPRTHDAVIRLKRGAAAPPYGPGSPTQQTADVVSLDRWRTHRAIPVQ
jgi:hypothetical protein